MSPSRRCRQNKDVDPPVGRGVTGEELVLFNSLFFFYVKGHKHHCEIRGPKIHDDVEHQVKENLQWSLQR